MAIGSASKDARTVIARLGILDRVDAIADGDSVERQAGAGPVSARGKATGPAARAVHRGRRRGLGGRDRPGGWDVGAAHVVLPSLAGVRWTDLLACLGDAVAQR